MTIYQNYGFLKSFGLKVVLGSNLEKVEAENIKKMARNFSRFIPEIEFHALNGLHFSSTHTFFKKSFKKLNTFVTGRYTINGIMVRQPVSYRTLRVPDDMLFFGMALASILLGFLCAEVRTF